MRWRWRASVRIGELLGMRVSQRRTRAPAPSRLCLLPQHRGRHQLLAWPTLLHLERVHEVSLHGRVCSCQVEARVELELCQALDGPNGSPNSTSTSSPSGTHAASGLRRPRCGSLGR
jgi:hypothetical protein